MDVLNVRGGARFKIDSLKSIRFTVPNFSRPYIMYIIHYINPNQLDNFCLRMRTDHVHQLSFEAWLGTDRMVSSLTFTYFLSMIPNVSILSFNSPARWFGEPFNVWAITQTLISTIESEMMGFGSLLVQ